MDSTLLSEQEYITKFNHVDLWLVINSVVEIPMFTDIKTTDLPVKDKAVVRSANSKTTRKIYFI